MPLPEEALVIIAIELAFLAGLILAVLFDRWLR
jgi:hypothetical protein